MGWAGGWRRKGHHAGRQWQAQDPDDVTKDGVELSAATYKNLFGSDRVTLCAASPLKKERREETG